MNKLFLFLASSFLLLSSLIQAQTVTLEAYVFEDDNRGFLNEVSVKLIDQATEQILAETFSNQDGFFTFSLPMNKDLLLKASKNLFFSTEQVISTHKLGDEKKVFSKIKLKRRPGYLLELTLAEAKQKADSAISITDTHIEVYNNTTNEQELDIPIYPSPEFKYTLQRGNHYTFLIRKEGYFNKRIEAYVDVKGCIVCIDGVKEIGPGPGVSDNLTQGFEMGTLLANLELEKAGLDQVIALEHIYYDYNSAVIRPDAAVELDKVITLLKANPVLLMELGSHTDSKGQKRDNRKLSQARVDAALAYIVKNGEIAFERLSAKGYGESQIINRCVDDVECTDKEHQENRRTELKIIGYADSDPIERLSLADILSKEREEVLLREVLRGEVVQVPVKREQEAKTVSLAKRVDKEEQRQARSVALVEKRPAEKQVEEEVTSEAVLPPAESKPKTVEEKPAPDEHYDFLDIKDTYVGYKIEILSASTYLDKDHKLFDQYKNVYVQQVDDTHFSYLIGHFKEQEDAQLYVDALLANEYPQAKVVGFEDGKRQ